MKIGIIGSGKMGSALGRLWASQGHKVVFGSRDPQKAKALAQGVLSNTRGGSYAEAARFGGVILLATPWSAAHEALEAAGPVANKVLIDCTNPLMPDGGGLVIGGDTSAAEAIAEWQPYAKVVKAFNTVHWQHLYHPVFGTECVNVYLCGDDSQAKQAVAKLTREIGLEPVDVGSLQMARHLESLAYLWIHMAFKEGLGPDFTFRFVRR